MLSAPFSTPVEKKSWCYYPHRPRDLVSPVCGIFSNELFCNWFLSPKTSANVKKKVPSKWKMLTHNISLKLLWLLNQLCSLDILWESTTRHPFNLFYYRRLKLNFFQRDRRLFQKGLTRRPTHTHTDVATTRLNRHCCRFSENTWKLWTFEFHL